MYDYPLAVRSSFEHSSALHTYIERSLGRALRPHADRVKRVDLWLADTNGPRHGAADKRARVMVTLVPRGRIVATAASDDLYNSVARAIARARSALSRRVSPRKRHETIRQAD